MKFLGWILLLSVTTLHAQEVIESTPLSVEDTGARQINDGKPAVVKEEPKEIIKIDPVDVKPESLEAVDAKTKKDTKKSAKVAAKKQPKKVEDHKATAAIVIAPVETPVAVVKEVNPQDGQLKLDAAPVPSKEIRAEDKRIDDRKVIVPVKSNTDVETIAVVYYEEPLKKYLQFSFGYLNSRYEKINSNLDNGSTISGISFVSDFNRHVQAGFTMEILSDKSGQSIPDNIRVVQYRVFADYHAPIMQSNKFNWVGGFSFSIGDYGIRRRYINLQGEEASVKISEGTIVGLIPAAGVRIYLVGRNSIDLMAEYHQYFGNPQHYIGGLAFVPRFSFEF
ncbi:MAG: hypothetical protein H7177_11405 [Rhizobacter sp.]|nr:hypothetical protein [Bacteriovorax sp.]